jgi:pyruvate dehydrogenase E1 component beta subunit
MFGGLFELPMLFRLIVGRSWGQGAQHSQSLQSLLGHIPGLTVIMPSSPASVLSSYREAIFKHRGPVVSFEHRLMYELSFDERIDSAVGLHGSRIVREGTDVTIVATSVMVLESKRAAAHLQALGVSAEVIDLHSISHPNVEAIIHSLSKTGRLLIADTSWSAYGVAAEINRLINEHSPGLLRAPAKGLCMQPSPCPTAKALEELFYPDVHDIVRAAQELVGVRFDESSVPRKQSMTDYYKHFKGPF